MGGYATPIAGAGASVLGRMLWSAMVLLPPPPVSLSPRTCLHVVRF